MIQIFGTKKCKETQKAQRFLKERSIKFQYIDLNQKGLSEGELESIESVLDLEDLIDTSSKLYSKMNLEYMNYDAFDVIFENPLIIKTPLIREKKKVFYGFDEEKLKDLI